MEPALSSTSFEISAIFACRLAGKKCENFKTGLYFALDLYEGIIDTFANTCCAAIATLDLVINNDMSNFELLVQAFSRT